jgi:hypothetical protein
LSDIRVFRFPLKGLEVLATSIVELVRFEKEENPMSARKHILLDILGLVISLHFFPISKNPRIAAILEFIGWLAAVVVPINIALQLGNYLHGQTPAWVEWPVALILLVALFFWTLSWILYALSRLEPEIPGSEAAIEAWFRTHFPDMPAKYRIGDIRLLRSTGCVRLPRLLASTTAMGISLS